MGEPESSLERAIDTVLDREHDLVERHFEGNPDAIHFLVGAVMEEMNHTEHPADVRVELKVTLRQLSRP